jgi:hypothetical protein
MLYSLDYNERIALGTAMHLVLTDWKNGLPLQVVMEAIHIGDEIAEVVVSQMYEDLSKEDVYNLIWQFQEAIYEAMCVSDFNQGIRSEFTKGNK